MTQVGALLGLSALLVVGMMLPRLRPGWPVWLRMTVRVASLVVATFLAGRGFHSPLDPRFDPADTDLRLWQQAAEAGWWVLAGRVAVGAARLFVVLKHRPRESRILSDLLAGVIYVATALGIVTFAFSVPLGGLLATSGVIAIVLGLALQSTLSDVFSGIAVGLERPYGVGDVIWIEGGIEGRVREVNWRSTQVGTADGDVAIIPNSVIAKARLINHSAPTPRRSTDIEVRLDPAALPERCIAALTAALRHCGGIEAEPAPSVRCNGLSGEAASYKVAFSVPGSERLLATKDELWMRIHVHLRHAGITLAVPGKKRQRAAPAIAADLLLEHSDLFGVMESGHRALLASALEMAELPADSVLLRQGETPDALLLLAEGTVGISLPGPDGMGLVTRLGPGETLGGAGLVTGQPFTAHATALTPLRLYRLTRPALAAAVARAPELAGVMEAFAARVLQSMPRDDSPDRQADADTPDLLLGRLRAFLRAVNAA